MHTPGPWKWYWKIDPITKETDCGIFSESRIGMAYSVARCPRYQNKERWEEDAKLIAMAPTLLEHRAQLLAALKVGIATNCLTRHTPRCNCKDCSDSRLVASIESQMKGEG